MRDLDVYFFTLVGMSLSYQPARNPATAWECRDACACRF